MNYNLNALEWIRKGVIYGTTLEVTKADTRSLDYSSYGFVPCVWPCQVDRLQCSTYWSMAVGLAVQGLGLQGLELWFLGFRFSFGASWPVAVGISSL